MDEKFDGITINHGVVTHKRFQLNIKTNTSEKTIEKLKGSDRSSDTFDLNGALA